MSAGTLQLQHCTADLVRGRILRAGGHEDVLTTRELALLGYMVERAGQTVSRTQLLEEVWGYAPQVMSRACDNGMARLRNKLEVDPAQPDHLLTVHGEGYRFVPLAQDSAPVAVGEVTEQHLQLGGRQIDLQRLKITGASEGELTSAEAAVLAALMDAGGAVVDKAALSRAAGGASAGRGMANLVARLRAKIEDDPGEPRYLHTVRGVGYRLETGDVAPEGDITLLFTDIQGSSVLWRHLGDDMAAVLAVHDAVLTQSIQAYGGYLVGLEGDGLVAAFDRSGLAIHSALAAIESLANAAWPVDFEAHPKVAEVAGSRGGLSGLRVRMAVHAGQPHARVDLVSGRTTYAGPDVLIASRLVRAGHGGQLLATAQTLEGCGSMEIRTQDLGAHRLTGVSEPVSAFEVVGRTGTLGQFPTLRAASVRCTNLPPSAGAFIGRDADLAALESAWEAGARLLVVTGPAGVGKTQLARAHGAATLSRYSGGVWWCDLTTARDGGDAVQLVAKALGLPEVPANGAHHLGAVFQDRGPVLVILDNAETVPKALAKLLDAWLAAAHDARFLVTSQIPIRHSAARTIALRPFDEADGIRLFLEHAAQSTPDGSPDVQSTARRIVSAVDGMPLAIALAAARLGVLSAEQIADRLETVENLQPTVSHAGLLADGSVEGRHHSMRTALDWTWAHLDPAEQALLVQLGVFAGSFDHAAVEAVVEPGEGLLIDRVQHIVRLGLVAAVPESNPRRFRLLSAIRAYALQRMDGAHKSVFRRHAAHFAEMGGTPFLHGLRGVESREKLDRLMASWSELRAAHRWSVDAAEPELAADLSMAAAEVMDRVGPREQASRVLGDTASIPGMSTVQRVRLRLRSVRFHLSSSDQAGALRAWEDAMEGLASIDAPRLRVRAEVLHATLRNWAGEEQEPIAILDAVLPEAQSIPDPFYAALVHFETGLVKVIRHRKDADDHLRQALAVFEVTGPRNLAAWCLNARARVLHGRGDYSNAQTLALRSMEAYRDAGYISRTALLETALGSMCAEMGRLDEAEAHFETSARIAADSGDTMAAGRGAIKRAMIPIARGAAGEVRRGLVRAKRILGPSPPTLERVSLGLCDGLLLCLEQRMEEALAAYDACERLAADNGFTFLEANAACSAGMLHLQRDSLHAAGVALERSHAIVETHGLENIRRLLDGPRIEWLARTGRVDDARGLWERMLVPFNAERMSIQQARDRCHAAYIALADNDLDDARQQMAEAAAVMEDRALLSTSFLARDLARLAVAIG
jgi:DNA-binding response OmpR family regulator/predicted ATPase